MSVRRLPGRRAIGISIAALVLAGCTSIGSASDNKDEAPSQTASDSSPTRGRDGTGGGRDGANGAVANSTGGSEASKEGGRVTVAVSRAWDAYNSDTGTGRGPWNFTVDSMIKSTFWYLDPEGTITHNPLMGDFDVVDTDPLTVEYTINDKAVWSDGRPIGYADVLLDWAARSGEFTTADGEPLFGSVHPFDGKPKAPEGDIDERSFTIEYREPTASWETNIEGLLPAHVVAKQAGMTVKELVTAIQNQKMTQLKKAADFWNTGWQFTADSPVPDPAIIPSSGPYRVVQRDGSSLILKRNDNYWGPRPTLDEIVLRTLDPSEQAQALINGEVDIVEPQPMIDVYQQLNSADGIEVLTGDQFAYVHADFRMDSPVFRSLTARQAFAHCLPRQDIVDKLIAPVQPDAQVLDLREVYPFQPSYADVVKQVPTAADYAETDVAQATELLAQEGLDNPEVTIVVPTTDKRLAEAAALIADSCGEAGFRIKYETVQSLGDRLEGDAWDLALFQWSSNGQLGASASIYGTDQPGNYGRYSNPDVDQLLAEISSAADQDMALALTTKLEEALWKDLVTIPLYAQPQIVAVADRVNGVELHAWPAGLTSDAGSWTLTP